MKNIKQHFLIYLYMIAISIYLIYTRVPNQSTVKGLNTSNFKDGDVIILDNGELKSIPEDSLVVHHVLWTDLVVTKAIKFK